MSRNSRTPDGSDAEVTQQWLEESWRHGEVVADREGALVRFGPPQGRIARRVTHWVRQVLRVSCLPGRARRLAPIESR